MSSPPLQLPSLPEIGHPESYYARLVHRADRDNSPHAREAAKVGQYVTLAIDPHLSWDQKLRYFKHTLRRHCQPPKIASDPVWIFYQSLSDLVRRYAGQRGRRPPPQVALPETLRAGEVGYSSFDGFDFSVIQPLTLDFASENSSAPRIRKAF